MRNSSKYCHDKIEGPYQTEKFSFYSEKSFSAENRPASHEYYVDTHISYMKCMIFTEEKYTFQLSYIQLSKPDIWWTDFATHAKNLLTYINLFSEYLNVHL